MMREKAVELYDQMGTHDFFFLNSVWRNETHVRITAASVENKRFLRVLKALLFLLFNTRNNCLDQTYNLS